MNRNQVISLVLICILVGLFIIRSYQNRQEYFHNSGFIQGTTYSIKYQHKNDLHHEIDSLLHVFDLSLSTYIPNSVISRINQNDSTVILDEYFRHFIEVALKVSKETNGAFDITIAPVVNAWGFGFTEGQQVDSALIDSLLKYTGFEHILPADNKIIKDKPEIMLDGNAIAQGQSVDVVADYLIGKGIKNLLVDIGGEIKTRGNNPEGEKWRIGIDKPIENTTNVDRELQAVISITDKSLATSGNYRKFYEKDGVKYSHTIDPETGYPVKHNLLSATVITDDCIYADAYATAFMVMGIEKTKNFIAQRPNIDVFLIYADSTGTFQTYSSPAVQKMIEGAVTN